MNHGRHTRVATLDSVWAQLIEGVQWLEVNQKGSKEIDKVLRPSELDQEHQEAWMKPYEEFWQVYVKITNSPIALFQYARKAEAARQSDTKKMSDHDTAPTKDALLNRPTPSQARADLRGVVNLGSTYYLSASIHLLRACSRLPEAFTQDPFPNVIDMSLVIPAKPALFKSYLKLCGDIRSTMREVERIEVVDPYLPTRLLRTLQEQKPNWDQNTQQDAMEAFDIMQNALHEITNKASARRFSQQYAVDRPMAASVATHWSDVQEDQSSSEGEDPFLS